MGNTIPHQLQQQECDLLPGMFNVQRSSHKNWKNIDETPGSNKQPHLGMPDGTNRSRIRQTRSRMRNHEQLFDPTVFPSTRIHEVVNI